MNIGVKTSGNALISRGRTYNWQAYNQNFKKVRKISNLPKLSPPLGYWFFRNPKVKEACRVRMTYL